MANISTFLNNIRNAIYGEDVRSSIINALTEMNSDVTDVKNKADNGDFNGKSAFDEAVENGFEGTFDEWIKQSLIENHFTNRIPQVLSNSGIMITGVLDATFVSKESLIRIQGTDDNTNTESVIELVDLDNEQNEEDVCSYYKYPIIPGKMYHVKIKEPSLSNISITYNNGSSDKTVGYSISNENTIIPILAFFNSSNTFMSKIIQINNSGYEFYFVFDELHDSNNSKYYIKIISKEDYDGPIENLQNDFENNSEDWHYFSPSKGVPSYVYINSIYINDNKEDFVPIVEMCYSKLDDYLDDKIKSVLENYYTKTDIDTLLQNGE